MFASDLPSDFDVEVLDLLIGTSPQLILPFDFSRSCLLFGRAGVGGSVLLGIKGQVSLSSGLPVLGNSLLEIDEKSHSILPCMEWTAIASAPATPLYVIIVRRWLGRASHRQMEVQFSGKLRTVQLRYASGGGSDPAGG